MKDKDTNMIKPATPKDAYIAGQFDGVKTCSRCGETKPADVHTCTPKQDQSTDLNSKKPMDGDQILKGFVATGFTSEYFRLRCFNLGVRFAEKYHGIGGKE